MPVYNQFLITGVAGFVGSHIAGSLHDDGYHVIGVDDLSQGKLENVPEGIEFIKGDLSNAHFISSLPNNCNKILHLAGQSSGEISFDNPEADLRKNVISTLNLIQYGIENKSERMVYASSMSTYGTVSERPVREDLHCKPLSCYGVGKLAAENYLRIYQNQLPSVILRMFNIYGPGQDLNNLRQGMLSIFLAQAIKNKRIEVKGSLDRYRDFIFIDDVVDTWVKASFSELMLNRIFNVGTGVRTTVHELIKLIETKVPGSTHFLSNPTPGNQNGIYADTSQLSDFINADNFVQLEEGIERYIEWCKFDIHKTLR